VTRLLPDSLFARLFLAIIGAVVITLLILLALIVRERREFSLLESSADSSLTSIAETAENLARLAPQARDAALTDLRAQRRNVDELRRARYSERRETREMLERTVISRLQQ
jgi:uncharacterized membrane protein YgaE (UPF0421/DUF939 family)